MFCPKYKREKPNHILCNSICCVCESLVRSKRWLPSHILRIIKKENSIQELDDHSVVAIKSLKIYKQKCLCLLGIQENGSPWTWSYHWVVVVSFLLEVAIGC